MTHLDRVVGTRGFLERPLPLLWIALLAAWAAVMFFTETPAWPLSLWIAASLGPLALIRIHLDPQLDPRTE